VLETSGLATNGLMPNFLIEIEASHSIEISGKFYLNVREQYKHDMPMSARDVSNGFRTIG
jgi:hypothetical protein